MTDTKKTKTVDATDMWALIKALRKIAPEYLLSDCSLEDLQLEVEENRNLYLTKLDPEEIKDLQQERDIIERFHREHHGPGRADMCDQEPCRSVGADFSWPGWSFPEVVDPATIEHAQEAAA